MKHVLRELIVENKRIYKKFCFIFFYLLFIYSSKGNINNPLYTAIAKKFERDNFLTKESISCNIYDPIYLMGERLKKLPISICDDEKSRHICYQNSKYNNYNKLASKKYGVICLSENLILDPSKSLHTDLIYKGPVDDLNRGSPILYKGFFNMKCNIQQLFKKYNKIYNNYFNSWNYNYIETEEHLQELAPGKTVFFISRNQDSPNLFHGISEIINCVSIMYLFDIDPNDIQVVFLESINLKNDPFSYLYSNIISRGGKPIFINNLKRKYHINRAIHIPINWDSPAFIYLSDPAGYPKCKYSTQTYKILNNLINKYINIPTFHDSFKSDNETFFYPDNVIKNFEQHSCFNKTITIQWRKVWPKGRTFQKRILGNGVQLADKLASILPNNYLIRLVDTASLSFIEQVSIMRTSDYLIGIHGAGLSLSIFMPSQSVLYEIRAENNSKVLMLMSALSGHKVYSDIIKSELKIIDTNEVFFFDIDDFGEKAYKQIKDNDQF